jgi:phosphoribosylamine--glycine ligase
LVDVPITNVKALREWAQQEKIELTVVGPEAPLAAGVVDEFRAHSMRIFGPTQAAAQLESSKAFSKAFMQRHGIPTAIYETFTDPVQAHAYIDKMGAPIVVKADGLAAGKGVVVAMTASEAHEAIDFMLLDNQLGVVHNAGADGAAVPRVVIEEFLQGEEASFIVLCDGQNVVALATSQDHKRLLDHDEGPNTGGMGAYSPAPVVTAQVHARAMREVIMPTIKGMEKDGIPYTGFLYAGLMIDAQGHAQNTGVQLPNGRSRNSTDHDALENRSGGSDVGCHQRQARHLGVGVGPTSRFGRRHGCRRLPHEPSQR